MIFSFFVLCLVELLTSSFYFLSNILTPCPAFRSLPIRPSTPNESITFPHFRSLVSPPLFSRRISRSLFFPHFLRSEFSLVSHFRRRIFLLVARCSFEGSFLTLLSGQYRRVIFLSRCVSWDRFHTSSPYFASKGRCFLCFLLFASPFVWLSWSFFSCLPEKRTALFLPLFFLNHQRKRIHLLMSCSYVLPNFLAFLFLAIALSPFPPFRIQSNLEFRRQLFLI